jgi:uncharacterized protein with von Willebrand factor type A (vWA) domain
MTSPASFVPRGIGSRGITSDKAAGALTRLVDELLWALRRSGVAVATSQAIDAVRAVEAVGIEDKERVREAVAAVVVHHAPARARFDAAFNRFFARTPDERGGLWERLMALGFLPQELAELNDLLVRIAASDADGVQHLGSLLERGVELDRLLHLAGVARSLETVQSALQVGFVTYRILNQLALPQAHTMLSGLRAHLREALGDVRGNALADALRAELERASEEVRRHVQDSVRRRGEELEEAVRRRRLDTTLFTSLSDAEIEEVRRAVRTFADRLRGAERVRLKRARRGRIDPHRTLRRALRTGGVPFAPARKKRRRDKPRLILLCDVSDSVRGAARFMLEFVYAAHELFDHTRSFAFVSELGETTELFAREPVSIALAYAYGGGVVSVNDNSNYGRVLRTFDERYMQAVDRRTTVVILGDGRTNYHDDAAHVLDRIRSRGRALIWLCPEERAGWALGDSAMTRYAPRSTMVLEVRNARELETAARFLVRAR